MKDEAFQEYCDICGQGSRGMVFAKSKGYDLLRCERCNLIWTLPLTFDTAAKHDYYEEIADLYLDQSEAKKQRFRRQLQLVLPRLAFSSSNNFRLLEIGSGLGFFLEVCKEFGINAEGCDISALAVEIAHKRGNNVRLGTLDSHYQEEQFDAVAAFNLIEHLPHPRQFLVEVQRVLKPNGLVILEMPIQESLFFDAARLAYFLSNGRVTFFGVRPSTHIYKYSKKTFASICEDFGWEIVYQRNVSSPFNEIWGKSKTVSFNHKMFYRTCLPISFLGGKLTGRGNRLFIILKKLGSEAL